MTTWDFNGKDQDLLHTSQPPQILYKRHWQYVVSLRCVWRVNHRLLQIKAAHPNRILRGRYYCIILCIIVHFWDLPPRSFHDSQMPIMMQRPTETPYDDPQGSSGITPLFKLHVVTHKSLIALFSTNYLGSYFNLLAKLFRSLKFSSQRFDKIPYDNMIITAWVS